MYESTQDTHSDVEHMANHHDEDEPHPADTAIAQCLCANGVEGLSQFGTCQTQGVETQVTQHITEQARRCVD